MVATFQQPSEGEQISFFNVSICATHRRLPASASTHRELEKVDLIAF